MKYWMTLAALVASLTVVSLKAAGSETTTELKNTLSEKLGMDVTRVEPSPVDGLYQALTSRGLFYVSEDGSYLIHGRVYNMDKGLLNETEQALGKVRLKGINEFEDSMIEFKADNEQHQVTVFTDITCGYCRKMHRKIDDYNSRGITVRYLAFPRGGLNTETYKDMVSVWCSEDAKTALTEAKEGQPVASKSCKNKVRQHYEFGQKVGVSGTPAMILDDGSMIPGYQPPNRLQQVLNGAGS